MAKGSSYTRGLCIVLNILLGIFGVILLLFGVARSVKVEPVEDGSQTVNLSVGFGLATVLISLLGLYGASRESVLVLLLYSVLIVIEFLVLMVLAIKVTLTQTQKGVIEQDFDKTIQRQRASEASLRELDKLQLENRCCGLHDYTDWGEETPASCVCPPEYLDRPDHCVTIQLLSRAEGIRNPHTATATSQYTALNVYRMTCGPILIEQRKRTLKILLGIFFTLATITVAAVIVALLLCYKIHKRSAEAGASLGDDSRTKYELRPDNKP